MQVKFIIQHLVPFVRDDTEKNITKDYENLGDCSETVNCTKLDSEIVQPVSEEKENYQVRVA